MTLWRSVSVWDYFTGLQTTLLSQNFNPVFRPRNCGICSADQVIRAALSKTHLWIGWSSRLWSQPPHCAIAFLALSRSQSRLNWNDVWQVGFEPKTLLPLSRSANHCATGATWFVVRWSGKPRGKPTRADVTRKQTEQRRSTQKALKQNFVLFFSFFFFFFFLFCVTPFFSSFSFLLLLFF